MQISDATCRRLAGAHRARRGRLSLRAACAPNLRLRKLAVPHERRKTASHASPGRLHHLAARLRWRGFGQAVARTAGFNVASTVAAGLGGVILARVVGPTVRGEYAAITAWFGVAVMVGGMGQPAALCFYVARDPLRAREYVATSRAMMLTTGTLALTAGMLFAPVLARGQADVIVGYRIAFGTAIVAFVGSSYIFSLQARDLHLWNLARVSQPVLSLVAFGLLWRMHLLTLDSALFILLGTMLLQLAWAYRYCRHTGLAPGRAQVGLVRPLAAYGVAQIAALTPTSINAFLDQLVLSQTVPSADLGRYAIAVSLTSLPVPLVAAIGNVAFPRLASQRAVTNSTYRLQRLAVLGSAGIAMGMLVPLAVVAHWLVPLVFGVGYAAAVPLLWILTPGAVFLSCGQVVGDLLRGRNRPIVVAWAQGLAAVFTVVLLVVLLPFVGVFGAAIASTVAYGVALVAMLHFLWRNEDDGVRMSAPITAEGLVLEQ
jgi:O-antigen/teichoic acid export membrane protein